MYRIDARLALSIDIISMYAWPLVDYDGYPDLKNFKAV